jgi:C-terminal processing protease CtpA/Prc
MVLLLALQQPGVAGVAASPLQAKEARQVAPQMEDNKDIFKGLKDAFGWGEPTKNIPSERMTPWDRWTGKDEIKKKQDELQAGGEADEMYVDPSDASNYFVVELTKPMGIELEGESEDKGVWITKVFNDGSAAKLNDRSYADTTKDAIQSRDLLVGIDSTVVRGLDLDAVMDLIGETGDTVKLTLFRGSSMFLYGPTAPDASWYPEMLAKKMKE